MSWGRTAAPVAGRPAISLAPDAVTPDRAAVALRLSWRSKSRSVAAKPLSAGASQRPESVRFRAVEARLRAHSAQLGRLRAAGGSTLFASARVGRLLGESRSDRVRECPSWAIAGQIPLPPGSQVPELGDYWVDPAPTGFASAQVGRLRGRSRCHRVRKCPGRAVVGAVPLRPGSQVPELGGCRADPAATGFASARVGRLPGRSRSDRVRKCPSRAVTAARAAGVAATVPERAVRGRRPTADLQQAHGSPGGPTLRRAAARRPVGMPVVR